MRQQRVLVGWVYADPTAEDGVRVLVDRLWPPRLTQDSARLDEWCQQIAPSAELSTWFGCNPARFDEFTHRYQLELRTPLRASALRGLHELACNQTIALLTAIKHIEVSQATILADLLTNRTGT